MAKITIVGDAVVVSSALKLDDIKTIEKYRPKALVLKGGENGEEPVFAIGTTNGMGNINEVGASFGRESYDDEKLAVITMCTNGVAVDNIKEWVVDRIGGAIINLNKLEAQLPGVLTEIKIERDKVLESIKLVQ